ncbi:hypothetical protein N7504_005940 [Penicillium tannophilum]|nr:hypothetical protein N7504_005940 [Penicillium tannophilum]
MSSVTATRVRAFNALRRPQFGVGDIPNHYHFSVRSLPMVPGNAVFLANPFNGHRHTEGRTRITPLSPEEQANVIVPLLLESFVTRFDSDHQLQFVMEDSMTPWAPWSWSTTDEDLARAVSNRLAAVGVRPELCTVTVAPAEETQAANISWRGFYSEVAAAMAGIPEDQLVGSITSCCGVCGFTPSLDTSLMRCGRCKQTTYCSKACQKTDWSTHKGDCKAPAA